LSRSSFHALGFRATGRARSGFPRSVSFARVTAVFNFDFPLGFGPPPIDLVEQRTS
jgi:hypothetical protein